MESFRQGQRLTDEDLVTSFYANNVFYPGNTGNYYTPYWIRYAVGYIYPPTGIYYRIGPRYRIPYELDTGYLRPNMIIGGNWVTGTYEIRWKYKVYANSDIETRKVRFEVTTAGIYEGVFIPQDYLDLPAQMTIIP